VTAPQRRTARCALFVFVSAWSVTCRTHARAPSSSEPATTFSGDSVRGLLSRVGNDPLAVLLLTPSVGASREPVALGGSAASDGLRQVVGLELVVFGKRTGDRAATAAPRGAPTFAVQRFVVRAADGIAATDGVIVATAGGGFALRSFDGRDVPVAALPSSLRQMLGARVWLSGPLTIAPQAYGVIREPR
jgi:hypothetical protein